MSVTSQGVNGEQMRRTTTVTSLGANPLEDGANIPKSAVSSAFETRFWQSFTEQTH